MGVAGGLVGVVKSGTVGGFVCLPVRAQRSQREDVDALVGRDGFEVKASRGHDLKGDALTLRGAAAVGGRMNDLRNAQESAETLQQG
jgi:hypothetical protein